MRVAGHGGRLSVGYQQAASLGAWTLTGDPASGYQVTTTIADADTYWIAQRPLELRLHLASRYWRWRDVDPLITADTLSLTLSGPPETISRPAQEAHVVLR